MDPRIERRKPRWWGRRGSRCLGGGRRSAGRERLRLPGRELLEPATGGTGPSAADRLTGRLAALDGPSASPAATTRLAAGITGRLASGGSTSRGAQAAGRKRRGASGGLAAASRPRNGPSTVPAGHNGACSKDHRPARKQREHKPRGREHRLRGRKWRARRPAHRPSGPRNGPSASPASHNGAGKDHRPARKQREHKPATAAQQSAATA